MNTSTNVSDKLTSKKSIPEKSFKEEWMPVKGFEGKYEISNTGILKSKDRYVDGKAGSRRFQKGKIQKPEVTRKGYLRYTLSIKRGKSVRKLAHVLVAEHFIENPLNKQQVNHKDGVKSNNYLNNLEWSTCQENIDHAWKNGLVTPNFGTKRDRGAKSPGARKVRSLNKFTDKYTVHGCIKDAVKETGVSSTAISRNLNGHVQNPRKYFFEFI